jgi:hypothetical protein
MLDKNISKTASSKRKRKLVTNNNEKGGLQTYAT